MGDLRSFADGTTGVLGVLSTAAVTLTVVLSLLTAYVGGNHINPELIRRE
jgi:hypothetical protein